MPGSSQCRGCWQTKRRWRFHQNLANSAGNWKWVVFSSSFFPLLVLSVSSNFIKCWQYFAELYLISPFWWCFVVQSVWVGHEKIVPCGGQGFPNYADSFSTGITIFDRIDWILISRQDIFRIFRYTSPPKLRVGPWIEAWLWQKKFIVFKLSCFRGRATSPRDVQSVAAGNFRCPTMTESLLHAIAAFKDKQHLQVCSLP